MEVEESNHEKRLREAREFCRKILYDTPLTEEEYSQLECPTESLEERQLRERIKTMVMTEIEDKKNIMDIIEEDEEEEEPSLAEREKKDYIVGMEGSDSEIAFVIDNYVQVTYFVNALTGLPYNFNLVALSIKLLNYYVEYSCKKFAKVNLRHFQGPSHLIYKSSVIVETGSDNQALSRRLLKKTIRIFREVCGFPHINIDRRSCQNIVAAGYYSHPICMNVLKQRFQETRYNKEEFPGVVIKERELKNHLQHINDCSDSEDEELNSGEELTEDNFIVTRHYRDDDDDSELLREINLPVQTPIKREENDNHFTDALKEIEEEDTQGRGNCTFLVFQKGQIICPGCKSEKELLKAFSLLCHLLDECKETNPENRKFENDLLQANK